MARELSIPIVGVLKDYSTSRCSLRDTFKVPEVRDDLNGDAVWLHLQPARPFVSEVNTVDIRERTGSAAKESREASPDLLAIDSVIRPGVGQAWLSDGAKRRAIELYAMTQAIAHYKKTWPTVEDVSTKESFDLRCRDGKRELRVEVKGTSTGGGSILLTRNEVRHAEDPKNHVALFVVSGILVDSANTCSGGAKSVIEPWQLDRERLDAIAYEYHL